MEDTICALSTPQGLGAIALIRVSGPDTFTIVNKVFRPFKKGVTLDVEGYKAHFGKIVKGEGQSEREITVDEVVLTVFINPHSYTGEDVVEISCHGSVYIQEQILKVLLENGCRLAEPGEYTMRAFANGKMDLSQAEAVADLINSETKAAHQVALQQMRGGFSSEIKELREELINFASLIELELDFAEEDVEFADRSQLTELLTKIKTAIQRLLSSFDTGNVIKNGLPVAIVGAPNAGKSTLLNALLNEERALVSDVEGTTRDAIEDEITLKGIRYRFIDTAGIRETSDKVESMGIQRTFEKIEQSRLVLYLFDAQKATTDNQRLAQVKEEIHKLNQQFRQQTILLMANKIDKADEALIQSEFGNYENLIPLSALTRQGLDDLITKLTEQVNLGLLHSGQTIVTNLRHYDALQKALNDIIRGEESLHSQLSGDLLAMDIREALRNLGSIVGEIDVDQDILGNIFGRFCIGK